MTTIIVTQEDNEVDEYEFGAAQRVISIGRRSTNDVCIPDLSISGTHAKITLQDGHAWLEDLNSTNGTYVNGQIISRHSISNGDDIMMGKIRLALLSDAIKSSAARVDDARERESYSTNASTAYQPSQSVVADPVQKPESGSVAVQADISSTANGAAQQGSSQPADSNKKPKDSQHPLDGMEHLVVPPGKPTVTPMHELDSPGNPSKGAVIEIKNGAKSGQILPIDKPVTTLGRPGIQIAAIMRKPDGYFLMHIESDDSVDRPTLNRDAIGDEPVLLHSGDELNVAGIDVEFMLS